MGENPSSAVVLQVSVENQSENKQASEERREDTALIRQNQNALIVKNKNCLTLCEGFFFQAAQNIQKQPFPLESSTDWIFLLSLHVLLL